MFEWLRTFFRKRMAYVPPEQARAINARISLVYAALGWNIIGLTVYYILQDAVPRTPSNSVDYAKLLGVHDATVIQYSGLKKVAEYDVHLEDKDIEEFHTNPVSETTEAEKSNKNENITVVE